MRTPYKVLLPLAVAGLGAIALFVVGGGSAAPQRAFGGGSPSPTHYQHYPVADYGVNTQLFPVGGNSSSQIGLAITSLTMDNPGTSQVVAALTVDSGCNGGGFVLTRVVVPAGDTVHLEYAGEPLLAYNTFISRDDNGWCLQIFPNGTPPGNMIVTIVGYTYKA